MKMMDCGEKTVIEKNKKRNYDDPAELYAFR